MKKQLLLFILFGLLSPFCFSQLAIGDIAIIGYNTDSGPGPSTDHSFTFIALTDIPGSEVIYFTEEGWNDDADVWAGTSEGHMEWTAPGAGISCGSIIYITESGADVFTVTGGGTATLASGGGWNLSGGDQVLAYQADSPEPAETPTFITGLNGDDGNGSPVSLDPVTLWNDPSTGPLGTAKSGQPFGLTNGENCVSLFIETFTENDNAKYNGTLTGTSTFLRGEINDRTNWIFDNGTAYDITPGAYSPSVTCVAPCSNPTIPEVTFSPTTFCAGESTTLNISGTLNDATAWHIYTGSCGGVSVGTTAGTTFEVTPEDASTTYFVRGEGGCVVPGSCGTVEVTITPEDDASFSYESETYCPNAGGSTPTITSPGGTFTAAPAGLDLNAATGEINPADSDLGTYTITYNTSGDCPSSAEFTITIEDNDAPVPDLADLPDITAECEVTELTNPGVTDNCADPVIITNDASLPITDQGTYTITWTYDDGNGNTTTQTQTVIVDDVTGPTPVDPTLEDLTDECAITSLSSPSATDNCGGDVTVSSDATLPIDEQGTTVITWTYVDVNGNTTTQTQNVIIDDITAPVPVEDPLEDLSTACELNELEPPTATDNCDGDLIITSDAEFPITEATTVIWTIDDGNGNVLTQSQNIVFAPIDVSVTTDVITINANNTDADGYQWINCDDMSEIVGATENAYTAVANGNYAVIITEGECQDTSECVAISQVSIGENLTHSIQIYPNPAQNEWVTIQTTIGINSIQVVDLNGKIVTTETNLTNGNLNVSTINNGTYILIIQTESGHLIQKRLVVLHLF